LTVRLPDAKFAKLIERLADLLYTRKLNPAPIPAVEIPLIVGVPLGDIFKRFVTPGFHAKGDQSFTVPDNDTVIGLLNNPDPPLLEVAPGAPMRAWLLAVSVSAGPGFTLGIDLPE
jgi:hypothetical protein